MNVSLSVLHNGFLALNNCGVFVLLFDMTQQHVNSTAVLCCIIIPLACVTTNTDAAAVLRWNTCWTVDKCSTVTVYSCVTFPCRRWWTVSYIIISSWMRRDYCFFCCCFFFLFRFLQSKREVKITSHSRHDSQKSSLYQREARDRTLACYILHIQICLFYSISISLRTLYTFSRFMKFLAESFKNCRYCCMFTLFFFSHLVAL